MKKQQDKPAPLWKEKWQNYEFWPFWLFYAPIYWYGLVLAMKARSFTYFTAVNPALHFGGLLNTSKVEFLKQLNKKYRPAYLLINTQDSIELIRKKIEINKIEFPLVAKPDMGERGRGVEKINNLGELQEYLATNKEANSNIILQEFIEYPIELGVLYYRNPSTARSKITSIVIKEFLTIEGTGVLTLKELILKNTRARFRQDYLFKKFENRLNEIIPKYEKVRLEPIGNHNRGTAFLNGNHLINKQLVNVIDDIAQPLKGFYYGRFDLKTRSIEDLNRGEHIKIMEINGVNSEPAHIYQPGYSLKQAYRDIKMHMHIIYLISQENHKKGIPYSPLNKVLKEMYKNITSRS